VERRETMAKANYTDADLKPYLDSLSDADRKLSTEGQRYIAQQKYDWNAANAAGNKSAMDQANRNAEQYRWNNGGYYAGKSGDQYITGDDVYVSSADKKYMNNDQMDYSKMIKAQEKAGYISQQEGNKLVEEMRGQYGYSGGPDGSKYIKLKNADGSDQFSYEGLPESVSRYQQLIQQMSDNLLNQKPFSYDPASDPLYQLYAQQYTAGGQSAMQNTLAQIAARTGGLASSYAGTAAQNSYNGYMAQLANKIPELYQMAYGMYRDRQNDMRDNLAMLQGLSDSDYNRYSNERNFAYQNYLGNRDYNYQVGRDKTEDTRADYEFETQMNQQALETAIDALLNGTNVFGGLAADGVDPNTYYALMQQYLPNAIENRYWPGAL
jgi:hypothetical protein